MLKHILIITNPSSGKRKGKRILEEVEIILTKKNYEIDILMTEYRKHAQQFMTSSRIAHYDFIIVIGGDGTLHEVINGLLNRKDDIDIPIVAESVISFSNINDLGIRWIYDIG